MDHFFQIRNVGPAENEMLEGWSALAFAAGHTNRIKLGTMVTGVTYRYPGLLVKTATTLDVLSHGRAYLGIGAAWNEEEHAGLGVPFPPTAERFERLEETLQIAHQMWSGKEAIQGKHYHLERALNSPQAIQNPHPPILIGGTGERKTLRFVAQYADACNLFARLGKDELKRKLEILQLMSSGWTSLSANREDHARCLEYHRDGNNGSLSPSAAIEYFASLAELGINHALFSMPGIENFDAFDILATEIIPKVEKIKAAGR